MLGDYWNFKKTEVTTDILNECKYSDPEELGTRGKKEFASVLAIINGSLL